MRDHDPETTPALAWLHRTFAAQNTTADDIVHSEHQRQGAVNVSVRNVITSLRLISSVDWAKFFESVSLVDELMRERSSYAAFDFSTRDLYRHAIEDLARRSRHTELEVARRALEQAATGCERGTAASGIARMRSSRATTWCPPGGRELGTGIGTTAFPGISASPAGRVPWASPATPAASRCSASR